MFTTNYYFFVFNNIVFCTQLAFVFDHMRDFYSVHDHNLASFFSDFDTFCKTFYDYFLVF